MFKIGRLSNKGSSLNLLFLLAFKQCAGISTLHSEATHMEADYRSSKSEAWKLRPIYIRLNVNGLREGRCVMCFMRFVLLMRRNSTSVTISLVLIRSSPILTECVIDVQRVQESNHYRRSSSPHFAGQTVNKERLLFLPCPQVM